MSSRPISCILGAGYSRAAGGPLTSELFVIRRVAVPSKAAAHRFRVVWSDYEAWLRENAARNPEEYLADLFKQRRSAVWTLNERYVAGDNATEPQGFALPIPDIPVPRRAIPPFEWAVELLGAVLATPLPSDTTATNFRYGARVLFPFHSGAHSAFWEEITAKASRVSVITTNYDILIERVLRHRRMSRVFGPGCYYAGIARPQLLRGTQLPWAYQGTHLKLDGAVPIHKLHGSLNWSRTARGLELFQDLRPAFRGGGDAAIIPPLPEKEIPTWLRPVWTSARQELAEAAIWVVCGYSLPSYDLAVAKLLRDAAAAGNLRRILIL